MATDLQEILIFGIAEQRFALPLSSVERVIRAQAITKVANSPAFINGVIDYYGEVIAVINLRLRFAFTTEEIKLSDSIIVVNTATRKLALIVDCIEDVYSPGAEDMKNPEDIDQGLKYLKIMRDDKGIVLIYDLENVLSVVEEIELKQLLEANFEPNVGV